MKRQRKALLTAAIAQRHRARVPAAQPEKPCLSLSSELTDCKLDDAGIERLVQHTHADVQKIRALCGLPPYDFSKRVPSKSEKWAHSEKVQQSYTRRSKRKAANA